SAWIGGTARLNMADLEARRAFYMMGWAFFILVSALALSLAMVLAEVLLPHVTEDVRLAARNLVRGPLRFRFWLLAIGAGLVLPIVLLSCVFVIKISLRTDIVMLAVAALLALAGVWWFEDVWVKAGQSVPLS